MTTPTAHRPNPGDLAARAAARPAAPTPAARPATAPAEAVAPVVLLPKERMRTVFLRGVRISRMHPEARLVALTLLGYSNFKTGLVSPRHRPSSEQLAEDTGLTAGQVQVQIQVLAQRGWLYTRRIAHGEYAGQLGLNLSVPAPVLDRVRAAGEAEQATPAS
jgi:hypothetical protein